MRTEGAEATSALSLIPNFKIGRCREKWTEQRRYLHNKKGRFICWEERGDCITERKKKKHQKRTQKRRKEETNLGETVSKKKLTQIRKQKIRKDRDRGRRTKRVNWHTESFKRYGLCLHDLCWFCCVLFINEHDIMYACVSFFYLSGAALLFKCCFAWTVSYPTFVFHLHYSIFLHLRIHNPKPVSSTTLPWSTQARCKPVSSATPNSFSTPVPRHSSPIPQLPSSHIGPEPLHPNHSHPRPPARSYQTRKNRTHMLRTHWHTLDHLLHAATPIFHHKSTNLAQYTKHSRLKFTKITQHKSKQKTKKQENSRRRFEARRRWNVIAWRPRTGSRCGRHGGGELRESRRLSLSRKKRGKDWDEWALVWRRRRPESLIAISGGQSRAAVRRIGFVLWSREGRSGLSRARRRMKGLGRSGDGLGGEGRSSSFHGARVSRSWWPVRWRREFPAGVRRRIGVVVVTRWSKEEWRRRVVRTLATPSRWSALRTRVSGRRAEAYWSCGGVERERLSFGKKSCVRREVGILI